MIARDGHFVRVSLAGIIKPDERAMEIIRCLGSAEARLGRMPTKVIADPSLMLDLDLLGWSNLTVRRVNRPAGDKINVDLWAESTRSEAVGAPARVVVVAEQMELL